MAAAAAALCFSGHAIIELHNLPCWDLVQSSRKILFGALIRSIQPVTALLMATWGLLDPASEWSSRFLTLHFLWPIFQESGGDNKRRVWLESCRIEPTWWRRRGPPVSFRPCYRLPVTLNAKWAVPQWLCSCLKSNPVWSRTCRIYDFVKQGEGGVKDFFFLFFFMSFKVEGRWKIMFSISFQHHQLHSGHVMALPNHMCTFSSFL